MLKIPTINLNLPFILILLSCTFLSQCQTNTHQTIIKPALPVFNIYLKRHDQLKVTVYNMVGQVSIGFIVESKEFQTRVTQYCFMGKNITLEHTVEWNAKGLLLMDIMAYEYSYEITINGTVWKK